MKKNMRLFLVVMVVLALMLTIVACKDKTPDTTTAGKTTTAEPTTTKDPSTTADPTTTAPTTTTGAPTTDPVTSEPTVTTTAPTTDAPVVPEFPYTASGEWTVENGVYTSTKGAAMIAVGTAGKTGTFEVKMTALKGSDINDNGIFFGLTDKDGDKKYWAEGADIQYYWLFVSDAGTLALARLDGSWAAQGWVEIPGYTHGDEVTIKAIVANDGKIYCYANDQLLYTFTESAPYEGVVYGFRAEVAGVVFKDLKVTADATPIIPPKDPEDTSIEGAAGKWEVKDGVYTAMAGNSIIYLGTADDIFAGYTFEFCMNKGANGGDSGFLFGINDLQGDGKYWEGDVHYLFYGTANNGVDINAFWINPGWGNWQGLHYKPTGYANNKDVRIKFTPSLSDDGSKILVTAWFTYDMTSENPEWTLLYENKAMDTATAANLGDGYGLRAGKTGNKFWNIKITEPERLDEEDAENGASGKWWTVKNDVISAVPNSILVLGNNFTTGNIGISFKTSADAESYNGLIFGLSEVENGIFWEDKGVSYYFLSVDKDGNLVLSAVVDGVTTIVATAPIAGYKAGDVVTLKATVAPDGSVKAYANSALLITATPEAALTGTYFGVRAGDANVSFNTVSLVNEKITATPLDNYNVVAGSFSANFDSIKATADNSIIFSKDKIENVPGRYNLSYADTNGQNGLVAAYSYGANGASYYYVFIIDNGVYVSKVLNNVLSTLAVEVIDGFVLAGEHNITLEIVDVTVDVDAPVYTLVASVDGVKAATVTDNAPITAGNTYGAILSKDAALNGMSYFNAIPADLAGYTVEHDETNSMVFDTDFVVHSGKNTIALKNDANITNASGQYVLKFNNTNAGDNGLIFAHSRTGDNTWEGRGTSYYFVFLNEEGVHIGKTTNGTWKGCANFKYAESPLMADDIPAGVTKGGYTKSGEHELVVNYSGNGIEGSNAMIWVYLDGLYLGSWADSDPLFGTGYGVRAGAAGVEFTELRRDSLRLDTYWYNPNGTRDVTYIYENGTAILGEGTNVLSSEPASNVVGRYTLEFNLDNAAAGGQPALIVGHRRSGNKNWAGEAGVEYYRMYIKVDGQGGNDIGFIKYDDGVKADIWYSNRYNNFNSDGNHKMVIDIHANGRLVFWYDDMYVGSWLDNDPLTGTGYGISTIGNGTKLNSVSYTETIPEYEVREDAAFKQKGHNAGNTPYGDTNSYVVMDGKYYLGRNTLLVLGDTEDNFAGYTYEFTMQKSYAGGDSGFIYGIKEGGTVDGKFWADAYYVFYGIAHSSMFASFWCGNTSWNGWRDPTGSVGHNNADAVRFKISASATDDGKVAQTVWYTYDITSDDPTWIRIGSENAICNGVSTSVLGTQFGLYAEHMGCNYWDIQVYETADPTNVVFDSNGTNLQ